MRGGHAASCPEASQAVHQRYFSCALNTVVTVATSPARSERFDGTISVLLVLARLANAATYSSATLRLTALRPPGELIASATWRIALALASAMERIAAAWPCAVLISACFTPSDWAIAAARAPAARL